MLQQKLVTVRTNFSRLVAFAKREKGDYTYYFNKLERCTGVPKVTTTKIDEDNYLTTIEGMPANITDEQVMAAHILMADILDDHTNQPPYTFFNVERFDTEGFRINLNEDTGEWERK